MSKRGTVVALAAAHTAAIITIGYILLGLVPMALFAFGFVGGLAIWLFARDDATFADVRLPYFLTLGFFVLHKIEERELDFFPALSQLTGVPMPQVGSPMALLLYALAAAWLLVPLLMRRGYSFGHYLAWTFFVSMGVVELAHFVFPLFEDRPYGYFPGMASVVPLASVAWWGLYRMIVPTTENAAKRAS